jgi:hypothetical protein
MDRLTEKDIIINISNSFIKDKSNRGVIEINRKNDTTNSFIQLFEIALEKINQIDGDGNEIESKDNNIPFDNNENNINNYIENYFETYENQQTKLDGVDAINFGVQKKFINNINNISPIFGIDLFYLKNKGNITILGEEKITANKEDIKFNINLKDWFSCKKCKDNNGRERTAAFIDLIFKINKNLENGIHNNITNTLEYNQTIIQIPNDYIKDGQTAQMQKNYPKFNSLNKTITFRFSSDSSNIKYEAFVRQKLNSTNADNKNYWTVIVVIAIILMVFMIVFGILIFCRSYSTKKESSLRDSSIKSFQDK